jgi:hypothetical protein
MDKSFLLSGNEGIVADVSMWQTLLPPSFFIFTK